MPTLSADIAAFDRMTAQLEADHMHAWVLFHAGEFLGAFDDFEAAATFATDQFDGSPCLIRKIGAGPIQLPGGMVFRPAHALDSRGL